MWSSTTNYSSNEDGDSVNNSFDEYDDSALSTKPFSSVPESPNDFYGEETKYDKEYDDKSSYLSNVVVAGGAAVVVGGGEQIAGGLLAVVKW
jgi:hypothetical protein